MRHPIAFPDADLERTFQERYSTEGLPAVRLGLALGAALYAGFGLLDLVVASADLHLLWPIRAVEVALLLSALAFSLVHPAGFLRRQRALMAGITWLGGAGIIAMIACAGPPVPISYPPGLMLVVLYGFFLARLHFGAASLVGGSLTLAYLAVALSSDHIPQGATLTSGFFLVSTVIMGMLAAFTIERLERQRFVHLQTIEEVSVRDPLTGLFNRRHLDERVVELVALRRRYGVPGCLVLLDLDGFKAINDLFGHWTGDTVLREVARQLVSNARATDLVFRYGGDEFCLLLPNSSCAAALAMLERVRAALRAQPVGEAGERRVVDLSGGCIAIPDGKRDVQQLIDRADALLMEAKRQGKGRILTSEEGAESA